MKLGKGTRSYHSRANELIQRGNSFKDVHEIVERENLESNGYKRYSNTDSFRQAFYRAKKKL